MGMREEFENDPHFKGMDFTRSFTHPEYYESPYANGAWEGWQASRTALVIELPEFDEPAYHSPGSPNQHSANGYNNGIEAVCVALANAGVSYK
jgi:hypothetical protein